MVSVCFWNRYTSTELVIAVACFEKVRCTHLQAIRYWELMDMEAAGTIVESSQGHISLSRVERRRVGKANMANDAIVSESCLGGLWSQLADLGTGKE